MPRVPVATVTDWPESPADTVTPMFPTATATSAPDTGEANDTPSVPAAEVTTAARALTASATAEELHYLCADSGAKFIFAQDQEQVDKALADLQRKIGRAFK